MKYDLIYDFKNLCVFVWMQMYERAASLSKILQHVVIFHLLNFLNERKIRVF